MHAWLRSAVVLLALLLLFGSTQCMVACSLAPCQSHNNLPPCHHHPQGSHLPSACSHPMTMVDSRHLSVAKITLADFVAIPFLPVTSLLPVAAMEGALSVHTPSPPGMSAVATVILRI